MIPKQIDFSTVDMRRLGKNEKEAIEKHNLIVLDFPEELNIKNFDGYAVRDEIVFDNEWKDKKIILLKKDLPNKELIITFWHELGHFLLRRKNRDKSCSKKEKEEILEKFAQETFNKLKGNKK